MNTNININELKSNYPSLYTTYCPLTKTFTFISIDNIAEEIASFLSEYDYELAFLITADVIVLQPRGYDDDDNVPVTLIDDALAEYGIE